MSQSNIKKEINVDGYKLTFDSEWTKHIESKEHWGVYWNQAWLVYELANVEDRLLEIGLGSGFLTNYLKSRGWSIKSIDIDEDKRPDIVCDASSYDFSKEDFSIVLAFEVFEHIPFPLFKKAVQNIAQQNPKMFIFSLPWSVQNLGTIQLNAPKILDIFLRIDIPKRKILTKNHFWELKRRGSTPPEVLNGSAKGLVSIKDVALVFDEQRYAIKPIHKEGRIQFFKACRHEQ